MNRTASFTIKTRPIELRRQEWGVDTVSPKMSRAFYENRINRLLKTLNNIDQNKYLHESVKLMMVVSKVLNGDAEVTPELIKKINQHWPMTNGYADADPIGFYSEEDFKTFITDLKVYLSGESVTNPNFKKSFNRYDDKIRAKKLEINHLRAELAKAYYQLANVVSSEKKKNEFYREAASIGFVPAQDKLEKQLYEGLAINEGLESLRRIVETNCPLFLFVSYLQYTEITLDSLLKHIRNILGKQLPRFFEKHHEEMLSLLDNEISRTAKPLQEDVSEHRLTLMKVITPCLKQLNSRVESLFDGLSKNGDGDYCYLYARHLRSWYSMALQSMMELSAEKDQEFYELCHKQYHHARCKAIDHYQQAVFMGQDHALMPLAKIYIEELSKEASDKKTKQQWLAKGHQCLEQAMDAKIGEAYLYKAKQYHNGLGEEKNLELARFYYQQAMLLGVSAAKDELKKMRKPAKLYEENNTNNVEYLSQIICYEMAGGDDVDHDKDIRAFRFHWQNFSLSLSTYREKHKVNESSLKTFLEAGTYDPDDHLNFDALNSISLSATLLLLHSGAKTVKAEYLKNIDLIFHEKTPLRPQFRQMMRLLTRHRCQYENYQPKPDENPDNAHYFTVLPLLFADPTSFTYFLHQVERTKDIKSDPVTRWHQAENRIIKQADEKQDEHLLENLLTYLDACNIISDDLAGEKLLHCLTHGMSHWINYIISQLEQQRPIYTDDKWLRAVKGGTALGDLLRHLYYLALTKPKAVEKQQPIDYDVLKASLENIGINELSMISQPYMHKILVTKAVTLFVKPSETSIQTLLHKLDDNTQKNMLLYVLKHHPDKLLAKIFKKSKNKAESLLLFTHVLCTYLLKNRLTDTIAIKLNTFLVGSSTVTLYTEKRNDSLPSIFHDSLFSVWEKLTSEKQCYSKTEDKIYRKILAEILRNPYPYSRQNKHAPYVNLIGNIVLRASHVSPGQSLVSPESLANKADQLDKTWQTIAKLTSDDNQKDKSYDSTNLIFKDGVHYHGLLQEKYMSVRTLLLRLYVFDKNFYKYDKRYKERLKKGQTMVTPNISPEMYHLEELMKQLVDGKDEQGASLNINRGISRSIAHDMFDEILMMIEEGVNPEIIEDLLFLICAGERWNVEHKKKFVERPLLSSFFRMADSNPVNEELRYWLSTWIPTPEYHKGNTLKFILPRNLARNVPKLISHTNVFVANKSYAVTNRLINKDPAITLAASLYELTQICRDEQGNQVWYKNENTDASTSINSNNVSQSGETQADTDQKTTTTTSAGSSNTNTLTNKENNDDASESIYGDKLDDDGGFDLYMRRRKKKKTTSSHQKPSTKLILETTGLNLTTLIAQDKELLKRINLNETSIRIDFGEIKTLLNTQPEKMMALMQASEQNVAILFNSIRYILFSNTGIKNFNSQAWKVIKKQLKKHQFLRNYFLGRIQELLTKPTGGNVELVLSLMRINGNQYNESWLTPIDISEIFKAVLKKSDNKTESLLVLLHVSYHYFTMIGLHKIIFKGMVSESALATYLQSDDFNNQLKKIITADNGIFALLNELIAGSKTYSASEDKIYRSILYKLLGPVSNENIFTKIINNKIIRLIYKDTQCNSAVKNTHKIKSPDVIISKARRLDKAYNKIATLSAQKGKENELYEYRKTVCDDLNDPYQEGDFFQLLQEKGMSIRTLMLRLYIFKYLYAPIARCAPEKLIRQLVCGKDINGESLNIDVGKHRTIAHAMYADLLLMIEKGCNPELIKDIFESICDGERWSMVHTNVDLRLRPLLCSIFRVSVSAFDLSISLQGKHHKGNTLQFILPEGVQINLAIFEEDEHIDLCTNDKSHINNYPAITLAASFYEITQKCSKESWSNKANSAKETKGDSLSTTTTSKQVANSTSSISFVVDSGVGQNKEMKRTHSVKSTQAHTTKKEEKTSKETSESKPVIREVSSKMDKRYPYLYGMTKKRAEEEKTNNLTNWHCNPDGLGF